MLAKKINILFGLSQLAVLFIFFSYLMMFVFYNLGGLDYLFHIKAGEYIVSSRSIPQQDIFSFTMAGKAWLDHEWLYQVIIYTIHRFAGIEALFLLKVIIFSSAFFLLALFVFKTDWVFAYPLLFYGLQIAIRRFTLRPDNISFLFLILYLAPFVFKKRKLLYVLPVLQLFWVNMHGFFFLGPAVLLLYLALGRIRKNDYEPLFYKTAAIVTLLVILACLATPHPVATLTYPFRVLKNIISGQASVFYQNIQELRSPLSYYRQRPFFIGYIFAAFVFLLFWQNLNIFYVGLYFVFSLFCLHALRNIYFFIPVGIAIFADRFAAMKSFFLTHIVQQKGFLLLRLAFLSFAVSSSLYLGMSIRDLPKYGQAYISDENTVVSRGLFLSQTEQTNPRQLLTFLANVSLPQRMFNTFNLGAPLIFNFYPERKVFVDGRTEVYGEAFFSLYMKAADGDREAFDQLVSRYNLQGFIIDYVRETPLLLIKTVHEAGFRCVYFNTDAIVFVDRQYLQETPSLAGYEIDFSTLKPPRFDLLTTIKQYRPSMEGYFNMGYILYMLGYYEQSQQYLQEVLRLVPDHALSYYFLADIYYRQGYYEQAFFYCRNSLFFQHSLGRANKLLAKIYYRSGLFDDVRQILTRYGIEFEAFAEELEHEQY